MYKISAVIACVFFGFILWIIFMVNTKTPTVLLMLIHDVPYGDKLAHIILFGLLTFFVNVGLMFRKFSILSINIYTGTLLVTIFVVVEEFSQRYVKSRTFDPDDLLADAIGILIFTCISSYVARIQNEKSRQRKYGINLIEKPRPDSLCHKQNEIN